MTDFERARRTMVDNQLRTSGITDHRLLAAMGEVPRERFVSGPRQRLAYIDDAQPIGSSRKMAAPAAFARLVQLAAIEHSDRVLDLGCGTGYSSAVIARLAQWVVGVEEDPELVRTARTTMDELGIGNVEITLGTLASASKSGGPYDVVVVEGVLESVPDDFFVALRPGGRLVAAVASPGRPAVAHVFVNAGDRVASTPAFDANLPNLMRPADRGFVF